MSRSILPSKIATSGHGPGLGAVVEGVAGGAVDLHVGSLAAGRRVQLAGTVDAAEAVLVITSHPRHHPLSLEDLKSSNKL